MKILKITEFIDLFYRIPHLLRSNMEGGGTERSSVALGDEIRTLSEVSLDLTFSNLS